MQLHLAPESRALLHVTSTAGELRIDGVARGRGTVDVELTPGKHVIEAVANGYQPERREVTLEAGDKKELSLSPKPERKVGKWVALGLGLAVVVGGAVALGVVLGTKDEPPLVPQLGVVYTGLKVATW